VRVIAGQAKGRTLRAPKGRGTRPTTDRVKESIFAIISVKLSQAVVLDLFAGSGALSIEALSRGASQAVLVENDPAAAACIKANLAATEFSERCKLLTMSAFRAVTLLTSQSYNFDIVFLDPPYERGMLPKTLAALVAGKLLRPGAVLVAEHSRKEEIDPIMAHLAIYRREVYGDTAVSFLQASGASDGNNQQGV